MRIAMVSEHASPLAVLGGVDAGGQNVHVAALATELARQGHEVVVHTRRDDERLPEWAQLVPGVLVHHVDAGPAGPIGKDELYPFMGELADGLARVWRRWRPDVVHAHFWMSGVAALAAARPLGVPVVQTFHALGVDPGRVTVVPCGVDTTLFAPEGPSEARPSRRHRLVFVGRLVERK
ncbi:MAG: glycosyltransferase, partial [Actinomycetota bacterium]